ncbi:MAG TPA: class I lanthipeptide [Kofleriaceae bacterium]|nr:class I lanthipeptide [Kofleriaceae bacterium]
MNKLQSTKKRLSFSKETLRSLGNQELKAVVGGFSANPDVCVTKNTPDCTSFIGPCQAV